jgi:hypothetical protein
LAVGLIEGELLSWSWSSSLLFPAAAAAAAAVPSWLSSQSAAKRTNVGSLRCWRLPRLLLFFEEEEVSSVDMSRRALEEGRR